MTLMVRAIAVIGLWLLFAELIDFDGDVSKNARLAICVFLAFALAEVLRPRTRR